MNSIVPETAGVDTVCSVMAAARRLADQTAELTVAAGRVVARRMALGMAGALNPLQSDHAEFALMVPEKVEAFSAAHGIMASHSGLLVQELSRLAWEEVHLSARATMAMAGCPNPVAFAAVAGDVLVAWFSRATTNLVALGMMSLGVPDAAMAPVRQQVASNIARLG